MFVVSGSASRAFSRVLASVLNCRLANIDIRRFPDGECYIRLHDNLSDETVLIAETTFPDEKIVELFLIQDAVREFEPKTIITIIPYFGYARQDKRFNFGEAISARALAAHVSLQTEHVITVDIHNPEILRFMRVPYTEVTAIAEIGKYFRNASSEIDIVIAPDDGALEHAKTAAEVIGCKYDFLEKKRLNGEKVEIAPKSLDVSGKRVVLIDDIISTGGTIVTAAHQLKAAGATEIHAACTHGLFIGSAIEKLRNACNIVVATDTIEGPLSKISAAPAVAAAVRKVIRE